MSEEKPDTGTNLGVLVPPKRKQGRPRKDQTVLPLGEKSTVLQKPDGRGRKRRRKKGDVMWPAIVDSAFIGQQVHGVLDGSFDAGYLLTVRVGDSQTVLRGVVFEPSLSVPISKSNDIAPSVRLIRRDEQTLPIMHPPAAITGPALSFPVPRLPLAPPVHNATPATQISLKGYQLQHFPAASTGSTQVLSVAAEPESGSSKVAASPHDRNDTASPSHPDEPGLQQKVEIQSDAQLQSA